MIEIKITIKKNNSNKVHHDAIFAEDLWQLKCNQIIISTI